MCVKYSNRNKVILGIGIGIIDFSLYAFCIPIMFNYDDFYTVEGGPY